MKSDQRENQQIRVARYGHIVGAFPTMWEFSAIRISPPVRHLNRGQSWSAMTPSRLPFPFSFWSESMTHESPPHADLLCAVHEAYLQFAWHESVCALYDLGGQPDEDVVFEGFCSGAGAVRGLDEMRRTTNALLNAAFYVAAFASSKNPAHGPRDFDFDLEIPALYVAADHMPRRPLLYAVEAALDLTPWARVQHGGFTYDPAGVVHAALLGRRDLLLPAPSLLRYSPLEGLLLQPAVTAIAAWFSQQRRPVRFEACELDAVAGGFIQRGQMA